MKLYNVIFVLLVFSILDNYLKAVFGISYFDDFANLSILIIGLYTFLSKQNVNPLNNTILIVSLLLFLVLTSIFLVNSFTAYIYELFKQLSFLFFIPIFSALNKFSIRRLEILLINFLFYLLSFNSLIIIIQYVVSPYIIRLFGISSIYIERAISLNRMSGIFENVNIYGDLSLLIYILNEIIPSNKHFKALRYVTIVSVLISTSKHAIIALIIILIVQNYKLVYKNISKAFYLFILLAIISSLTYLFNQNTFDSKIKSYTYLFSKSENLNAVDEGQIEGRAQNFIDGINILKKNNYFGNGMGTWGDYSSSLNSNIDGFHYGYNKMSDSSIVHLVVEQGYISILYFLLIFSGYFSIQKQNRKHFLTLFFAYLVFISITMGLSSGSWPILFSFIYAKLLFPNELKLSK